MTTVFMTKNMESESFESFVMKIFILGAIEEYEFLKKYST